MIPIARRIAGHDPALEAGIVQRVDVLRTMLAGFRGRSSALVRSRRTIGPRCCNDARPKCEEYERPNTGAATGTRTSLCTNMETRGDFKECGHVNNPACQKEAIPSPSDRESLISM